MTGFTGIKKDLQEYWNTQGCIYDFGYESHEECQYWQRILRDHIGDQPKKILDLGTGTGFLAKNLAALGHEVTGLDFSTDMTCQARMKMKKTGFSWDLVMGDAEHPDFPDNTFDIVICRYLLWTLPNPAQAVSEWVRVIRPGGTLIVIDGRRKRTDESFPSRVNRSLWAMSRRLLCGYSGIQGHNLEVEKHLPYFEGIGADEILSYYTAEKLTGCQIQNLNELPAILFRNLPWYLRFGYRSSGVLQIVSGMKPGLVDAAVSHDRLRMNA